MMKHLFREARFLLRQRSMVALLVCSFLLSGFAVITGLSEVEHQRTTITQLKAADAIDREEAQSKYDDPGYLAYYSFHLTYSEPTDLAFAALGERDSLPWKHRIRMLALEGQIYESDTQNAELAHIGKVDFVFVISALSPLLLILLFHDLFASERASGRYDFITTTAQSAASLWGARSAVRYVSVSVSLLLPFWLGAIISGSPTIDVAWLTLVCLIYFAFWATLSLLIGKRSHSAPKVASILIGLWLLVTFVIPIAGDTAIKQSVHSPSGGEILLTQREAVNDAWDIPVADTMTPFFELYPQYSDALPPEGFDWNWYYAFQHMGDMAANSLSEEYRAASIRKFDLASRVALLSPPMLVQRIFTRRAETDVLAAQHYEAAIRGFHQSLREFYYPWMFDRSGYDKSYLNQLPAFGQSEHSISGTELTP